MGAENRTAWGATTALAAAAALICALLAAQPRSAGAAPKASAARYALVHGCYALRSVSGGGFAAKSGAGYSATASGAGAAEHFRMQATGLGRYLLYGRDADFLAAGLGDSVVAASNPSPDADWRVDVVRRGVFTLTLPSRNRVLAVGPGGSLVLAAAAGPAARFSFRRARGCAVYPEIGTNAIGRPSRGRTPYGEVKGLVDAHMHLMAFEFLGGSAHCGRPWHRYGVPYAMVDCPDHYPNGAGAVLENALYGNPARTHDPVGWPTFKDWPNYKSLTHEGSYYKWLERAWRGGLRLYVNLFVDNAVLCELYPLKRNSCNEMTSVRLQARDIRELQNYIDAQAGGPGKGFFRIVTNPFQARKVINRGKLAVVLGIEVSKLFDCGLNNGTPECNRADIDRQLREVYGLGVRDMELVNKFDNGFAGVAGDSGETGALTNAGNRYETGQFINFQTCRDPFHDKSQFTPDDGRDPLVGNAIRTFLPPGATPVYPAAPHCNARGLSDLGEYLIRRMMGRGMLVDPDHLSVLARRHVLSLAEAARYSGVVSSHSWSTDDAYPRIYDTGGFITPYAGDSTDFVKEWRKLRKERNRRFYFGFGYGADMNGFGSQGGPREGGSDPVRYPFKSFDGKVTLHRNVSGKRVWDINVDGVSNYGLYPDWVEDLRKIAGNRIVRDMGRGAEAYLQTWERAVGVPTRRCITAGARFSPRGLRKLRLGLGPVAFLRKAGQPYRRRGDTWTYCSRGPRNRGKKVRAVFAPGWETALVTTTAFGHRAAGVRRGDPASKINGARPFGAGVMVARAGSRTRYVFGVTGGSVRWLALVSRAASSTPGELRRYLAKAGLR